MGPFAATDVERLQEARGVRSIIFKDLSINQGGVGCGGCGGSFFHLLVYWGKNNGIVDLKETEL